MRWHLACPSEKSPTGLFYFRGRMTVVSYPSGSAVPDATQNSIILVPEVSFFPAEAHVFPALAAAQACAVLLAQHAPGEGGFMPLPDLGEASRLDGAVLFANPKTGEAA